MRPESSSSEAAGPDRRAGPVAAVDDQVDASAQARRDQLVDGGVDRGIFAADAEAGDGAKRAKLQKFHAKALSSTPTR